MTAITSSPTAAAPDTCVAVSQHSLARSVLLHLAPGAALTGFIVAAQLRSAWSRCSGC